MKKFIITICLIISTNQLLLSQNRVQKLDGPRFGITYLDPGLLADIINDDRDINDDNPVDYKQEPSLMTQIGWQWETRFAEGEDFVGLIEWIGLVGGIEKGLFLPSVSALMGIRRANGFEIAAGPTASFTGFGMVFAVGHTIKSGDLNLPINIAWVPSRKNHFLGDPQGADLDKDLLQSGDALTLSVGFNFNRGK